MKPNARSHISSVREPAAPAALYEQVKNFIRERVSAGEWKPGDRIPSELNLVDTLGVSRMTINRALRELTEQGALVRLSGVGTFVAESKPQSTLLMIAHIGDEIRARGHSYDYEILLQARETASVEVAAALDLPAGSSVYHVICVHREDGLPVQLEDRYVNPASAPDFLQQDFTAIRPSQYLLDTVPAHEIEHVVEAELPTPTEAKWLDIRADQPCLTLVRRTWARGLPVTFARFVHPGSRYRLGCRFQPDTMQQQS
ncbi:histidine utilization repressor [Pandoraea sp.]|uniref:histidine utilization repressor n=1 Tax=Pandoraea sp. TaxID=1883445 RepID=UPI00121182AD|nr:histidine utilization repressor [Pandoraea sp.]TAL53541.1 MAG: histidine utilization repressor [Pandoraea sp.]TAM14917.1 MAG: histidine utilization repressor [Pandoraea sp.]